MATATERKSSLRPILWGAGLGLVALIIYLVAVQGEGYAVARSVFMVIAFTAIGVATGVAVGSRSAIGRWSTWDSVLSAILSGAVGVLFFAWGLTIWKLMGVVEALPGGLAIRDLFYGFWFLAATLVPYIVRRPGAAVAAEIVASIVSMLLGSEWGLTVLISGLAQGGLAEVAFAARGYKHYDLLTLVAASAGAALGSWVVDYAFWYNSLQTNILVLMLLARLISSAIFSGLLGKWIGDALAATGVLDNTALGRARIEE